MSEKTKIIQQMLTMQKAFIAKEQSGGIEAEDYYFPEDGDALDNYQARYDELARKLVDIAHAEKESRR